MDSAYVFCHSTTGLDRARRPSMGQIAYRKERERVFDAF